MCVEIMKTCTFVTFRVQNNYDFGFSYFFGKMNTLEFPNEKNTSFSENSRQFESRNAC